MEDRFQDRDGIFDTIINDYANTEDIVDLLNKQSKRIKELEEENLSLQEQSIRDNQNWKEKDQQIKELEEENQKLKQAQKQVAIEELEFVLKNFRNRPAYFDVARQELCLSNQDKQFIDFINNRIKELKGVDVHA